MCSSQWVPHDFRPPRQRVLANSRELFLATFQSMADSADFDQQITCEADSFILRLNNFQFVFLLFTFRKIFAFHDILYDILQTKSTAIEFCRRRISATIESMRNLRTDREFYIVYSEVTVNFPNRLLAEQLEAKASIGAHVDISKPCLSKF